MDATSVGDDSDFVAVRDPMAAREGRMFNALVRAHRQRFGMTQEELAATTGVSVRSIRNLEAGRIIQPRPATVRLLADAFELAGAERELLPVCPRRHRPASGPRNPGRR